MRSKKRLKKKIRFTCIILISLILLLTICILVIIIINTNRLKEKGYTMNQINKFYELSFDKKTILKYDYCENIDDILNKDYNKNNLEEFLKNCTIDDSNETPVEEPNKTPSETPAEKPTETPAEKPTETPTETPIETPTERPKVDLTLAKEEIPNQTYYIPNRLTRYLNYYEKNPSKTFKDVVTDVNCNIDYEFYTNLRPADLSKGYLMLVNKYYYLDKTYTPVDPTTLKQNTYSNWDGAILSKVAYDAYVKMLDDAHELGYNLIDTSPYRSYEYQSTLYNNYVKTKGLEWAKKSSAQPGHSEHQTGLASDIVKKGTGLYDFEGTSEFKWIRANAHKYGFILRYPSGKEYLTGYKYEPWHYRYVGVDVATYIYENDIVFEEYYAYFCEYKNEC